jgi:hypothetical protein
VDGLLEHRESVLEIRLPEGLAEFSERVAAPDVVDENIETLVAAPNRCGKAFHFGWNCVVDSNGDAAAAGGCDELGSFFNGFGADGRGWIFSSASRSFSRTAAGAVNGGACFAQCDGDASSGAAGGSCDERDFTCERFSWRFAVCFGQLRSPAYEALNRVQCSSPSEIRYEP